MDSNLPSLDRYIKKKKSPTPDASFLDRVKDLGLDLTKATFTPVESAIGLADIVSGGHAGKWIEDNTPIQFDKSRKILDSLYSEERKEEQRESSKRFDDDGFWSGVKYNLANPAGIVGATVESLPLMAAGGLVGRGIGALAKTGKGVSALSAPVLSGIGEGIITAGSQAEGIRTQTENRLLTGGQSLLAGVSGLATGVIGAGSGKLAGKLGLEDIDVALTKGKLPKDELAKLTRAELEKKANKNVIKESLGGLLQEGVLEELPQSVQEQILTNIALDKDPMEGVKEAGGLGMLSGAAMGGPINAYNNVAAKVENAKLKAIDKINAAIKDQSAESSVIDSNPTLDEQQVAVEAEEEAQAAVEEARLEEEVLAAQEEERLLEEEELKANNQPQASKAAEELGVDKEELHSFTRHVAKRVKNFTEFSANLVKQFGEGIKKFALKLWNEAKQILKSERGSFSLSPSWHKKVAYNIKNPEWVTNQIADLEAQKLTKESDVSRAFLDDKINSIKDAFREHYGYEYAGAPENPLEARQPETQPKVPKGEESVSESIPEASIQEPAAKVATTENIETKKPSKGINFEEHPESGYRGRTQKNASADVTIALATDFNSAGERLTKNSVKSQGKAYIPVDANDLGKIDTRANKIVEKLNAVGAKTLNIAGNGIYTMKGKYTQEQVDEFTHKLLEKIVNHPELKNKIESITTGGQTGFDEAGAKAAHRLGIQTNILAPKGWKYRDASGRDISDKESFIKRFNAKQEKTTATPKTVKAKMTFAFNGNQREGVTAATTADAIRLGERTATTRYEGQPGLSMWKSLKVGDIVDLDDGKGATVKVRITKPAYKLKGSGLTPKQWSKLEGWSVDYFNKNVAPKIEKAWQIQYELLETGTSVAPTAKPEKSRKVDQKKPTAPIKSKPKPEPSTQEDLDIKEFDKQDAGKTSFLSSTERSYQEAVESIVTDKITIDGESYELSSQQKKALKVLSKFMKTDQMSFTLSGYAGTGKTTIIKLLVEALGATPVPVHGAAFTHVAANVLKTSIGSDTYTVHALLGLRAPTKAEQARGVEFALGGEPKVDSPSVIIVDECSMLSRSIYEKLTDLAAKTNSKIIFMGDEAQIPPVGENNISNSFTKTDAGVTLSQVMRTSNTNPLMEIYSKIRSKITSPKDVFKHETKVVKYKNGNVEGVGFTANKVRFKRTIKKHFKKETILKNPRAAKIIAYTNKARAEWNSVARESIFGKNAAALEKGEILVAFLGGSSQHKVLKNSYEYQVVSVSKQQVEGKRKFQIVKMKNINEGNIVELKIVTDKKAAREQIAETSALHKNKQHAKAYKINDEYINLHADNSLLQYGYAITAHKSQGSTYQHVMIDENDMARGRYGALAREKEENRAAGKIVKEEDLFSYRLFNSIKYVAFSRAAKTVVSLSDQTKRSGALENSKVIHYEDVKHESLPEAEASAINEEIAKDAGINTDTQIDYNEVFSDDTAVEEDEYSDIPPEYETAEWDEESDTKPIDNKKKHAVSGWLRDKAFNGVLQDEGSEEDFLRYAAIAEAYDIDFQKIMQAAFDLKNSLGGDAKDNIYMKTDKPIIVKGRKKRHLTPAEDHARIEGLKRLQRRKSNTEANRQYLDKESDKGLERTKTPVNRDNYRNALLLLIEWFKAGPLEEAMSIDSTIKREKALNKAYNLFNKHADKLAKKYLISKSKKIDKVDSTLSVEDTKAKLTEEEETLLNKIAPKERTEHEREVVHRKRAYSIKKQDRRKSELSETEEDDESSGFDLYREKTRDDDDTGSSPAARVHRADTGNKLENFLSEENADIRLLVPRVDTDENNEPVFPTEEEIKKRDEAAIKKLLSKIIKPKRFKLKKVAVKNGVTTAKVNPDLWVANYTINELKSLNARYAFSIERMVEYIGSRGISHNNIFDTLDKIRSMATALEGVVLEESMSEDELIEKTANLKGKGFKLGHDADANALFIKNLILVETTFNPEGASGKFVLKKPQVKKPAAVIDKKTGKPIEQPEENIYTASAAEVFSRSVVEKEVSAGDEEVKNPNKIDYVEKVKSRISRLKQISELVSPLLFEIHDAVSRRSYIEANGLTYSGIAERLTGKNKNGELLYSNLAWFSKLPIKDQRDLVREAVLTINSLKDHSFESRLNKKVSAKNTAAGDSLLAENIDLMREATQLGEEVEIEQYDAFTEGTSSNEIINTSGNKYINVVGRNPQGEEQWLYSITYAEAKDLRDSGWIIEVVGEPMDKTSSNDLYRIAFPLLDSEGNKVVAYNSYRKLSQVQFGKAILVSKSEYLRIVNDESLEEEQDYQTYIDVAYTTKDGKFLIDRNLKKERLADFKREGKTIHTVTPSSYVAIRDNEQGTLKDELAREESNVRVADFFFSSQLQGNVVDDVMDHFGNPTEDELEAMGHKTKFSYVNAMLPQYVQDQINKNNVLDDNYFKELAEQHNNRVPADELNVTEETLARIYLESNYDKTAIPRYLDSIVDSYYSKLSSSLLDDIKSGNEISVRQIERVFTENFDKETIDKINAYRAEREQEREYVSQEELNYENENSKGKTKLTRTEFSIYKAIRNATNYVLDLNLKAAKEQTESRNKPKSSPQVIDLGLIKLNEGLPVSVHNVINVTKATDPFGQTLEAKGAKIGTIRSRTAQAVYENIAKLLNAELVVVYSPKETRPNRGRWIKRKGKMIFKAASVTPVPSQYVPASASVDGKSKVIINLAENVNLQHIFNHETFHHIVNRAGKEEHKAFTEALAELASVENGTSIEEAREYLKDEEVQAEIFAEVATKVEFYEALTKKVGGKSIAAKIITRLVDLMKKLHLLFKHRGDISYAVDMMIRQKDIQKMFDLYANIVAAGITNEKMYHGDVKYYTPLKEATEFISPAVKRSKRVFRAIFPKGTKRLRDFMKVAEDLGGKFVTFIEKGMPKGFIADFMATPKVIKYAHLIQNEPELWKTKAYLRVIKPREEVFNQFADEKAEEYRELYKNNKVRNTPKGIYDVLDGKREGITLQEAILEKMLDDFKRFGLDVTVPEDVNKALELGYNEEIIEVFEAYKKFADEIYQKLLDVYPNLPKFETHYGLSLKYLREGVEESDPDNEFSRLVGNDRFTKRVRVDATTYEIIKANNLKVKTYDPHRIFEEYIYDVTRMVNFQTLVKEGTKEGMVKLSRKKGKVFENFDPLNDRAATLVRRGNNDTGYVLIDEQGNVYKTGKDGSSMMFDSKEDAWFLANKLNTLNTSRGYTAQEVSEPTKAKVAYYEVSNYVTWDDSDSANIQFETLEDAKAYVAEHNDKPLTITPFISYEKDHPVAYYHFDPKLAKMLNASLAEDKFRNGKLFGVSGRKLLNLKNITTTVQFSMSFFHATTIMQELLASYSTFTQMRKMHKGLARFKGYNLKEALDSSREIAAIVEKILSDDTAAANGELQGRLKTLLASSGIDTDLIDPASLVSELFVAGGLLRQDKDLRTSFHDLGTMKYSKTGDTVSLEDNQYKYEKAGISFGAMKDSVNQVYTDLAKKHPDKKIQNLVKTAVFTGLEGTTAWLMESLIPKVKIAVFTREYVTRAERMAQKLKRPLTTEEKRFLARDVMKFVEDRFGEVNWKNMWMDPTFKSILQALFRSFTWYTGSWKALSKGSSDLFKFGWNKAKGQEAELSEKGLWLVNAFVAHMMAVGFVTAIYQAVVLASGGDEAETEEETPILTRMLYPRVSPTDPQSRLSIPSYINESYKILRHLAVIGDDFEPHKLVVGRLNSLITNTFEAATGEDWRGVSIRDEDDAAIKQAIDTMLHIIVILPISASTIKSTYQQKGLETSVIALSLLGMTDAPAAAKRSEATNLAYSYRRKEYKGKEMTPDQAELKDRIKRAAYLYGQGKKQPLIDMLESGEINKRQYKNALKRIPLIDGKKNRRYESPLHIALKGLSIEASIKVWKKMSDNEKKEMRRLIVKKFQNVRARRTRTPKQVADIFAKLKSAGILEH